MLSVWRGPNEAGRLNIWHWLKDQQLLAKVESPIRCWQGKSLSGLSLIGHLVNRKSKWVKVNWTLGNRKHWEILRGRGGWEVRHVCESLRGMNARDM